MHLSRGVDNFFFRAFRKESDETIENYQENSFRIYFSAYLWWRESDVIGLKKTRVRSMFTWNLFCSSLLALRMLKAPLSPQNFAPTVILTWKKRRFCSKSLFLFLNIVEMCTWKKIRKKFDMHWMIKKNLEI